MSKLNTVFNGASAYYNRQTALGVAEGNRATRHRELRERDLITHHSTAAEIASVEHRLAVQMRARDALAQTGAERKPHARLVGLAFLAAFVVATLAHREDVHGGVVFALFVATLAVVLAVGVPIFRRSEAARAETVGQADWDARGVCTWCGSAEPHVVDGEVEHPLVAHAVEVDAAVGR